MIVVFNDVAGILALLGLVYMAYSLIRPERL
jgi:hypothetical protein